MFIYVSQFLIYFFNHFIYTTLWVPSVQPTLRELADCSPDHDDVNKRDFVPRGIFFHINKCMKKTLNVNMCILLLKLHLPTFPPELIWSSTPTQHAMHTAPLSPSIHWLTYCFSYWKSTIGPYLLLRLFW